jgi:hypothetical protein
MPNLYINQHGNSNQITVVNLSSTEDCVIALQPADDNSDAYIKAKEDSSPNPAIAIAAIKSQ